MKKRGDKYQLKYHYLVFKEDIPRLSNIWRKRIKNDIATKLTTRPEVFGKPLRQSLVGYRSLRVGDYRVIFKTSRNTIYIFLIAHRSVVYREITKRK